MVRRLEIKYDMGENETDIIIRPHYDINSAQQILSDIDDPRSRFIEIDGDERDSSKLYIPVNRIIWIKLYRERCE